MKTQAHAIGGTMHQQLTAVDDGTLLHATEDYAVGERTHTLCEHIVVSVDRTDGTPISGACLTCFREARRMQCDYPTLTAAVA